MRTLLAFGSTLYFFATFTLPVLAESKMRTWLDKAGAEATLPKVTAFEIIPGVIKALLGLSGIVFLAVLMHAGFLWMTAQGNSEQLDKAKSSLVNSALGLIVILGAYAITTYVVSTLVGILTSS